MVYEESTLSAYGFLEPHEPWLTQSKELISEKQHEKDACNQKKDVLRPVKQDAKLKDRGPRKKDNPVENRMTGNPNYVCEQVSEHHVP
jgi:hypothetical protein